MLRCCNKRNKILQPKCNLKTFQEQREHGQECCTQVTRTCHEGGFVGKRRHLGSVGLRVRTHAKRVGTLPEPGSEHAALPALRRLRSPGQARRAGRHSRGQNELCSAPTRRPPHCCFPSRTSPGLFSARTRKPGIRSCRSDSDEEAGSRSTRISREPIKVRIAQIPLREKPELILEMRAT